MEAAKIIFLGVWLLSFGTIAFIYLTVYRKLPGSTMVDQRIFTVLTIHSPWWWTGLAACFAIAFAVIRVWPGRPFLWVVLALTELIPVGLLTMFLILTAKLKQAVGRINAQRQPE